MAAVTVSSKGQVVLPKDLRAEFGIGEGSRLEVVRRGDEIVMRPIAPAARERGTWRSWRGSLAGSEALGDHLAEHAEEIAGERLP